MIKANNIKHQYTVWEKETETRRTALDGVSMDVGRGEFVVILGPNGSGKSTFAKHLNVLLLPDEGKVWVDGRDTSDMAQLWEIRDTVGMVFQNPDNQLIGTSVEEDAAFGPEQRNLPSETIRSRVTESLRSVGLLAQRQVSPYRLSGGQKQRLAIAGTLAADTDCIVLDEPTAMLDPAARREVMGLLHELHRQGKTIILITHHTDEALGADRIILMNSGHVTAQGTPQEIFAQPALLEEAEMDMPKYTEAAHRLAAAGLPVRTPVLSEEDFAEQIAGILKEKLNGGQAEKKEMSPDNALGAGKDCGEGSAETDDVILCAKDLHFAYDRGTVNEAQVLKGLSLEVRKGEFLGLAGSSGAGKTTLAKHLNGLLKADSGKVFYKGQDIYDKKFRLSSMRKEVGLVFQNPEQQLFCSTLIRDVCFGPRNMGMSDEEALESAGRCLDLVGIDPSYYELSPYEMSGGQMRRAAIAGVLAMEPEVLILDEPAAGLDPGSKKDILDLLDSIRRETGTAIVLISHDMDDIADYADRMIVLHDGTVAREGRPQDVFSDAEAMQEIGIGVPEITSAMDAVRRRGAELPYIPVTADQAVAQILELAGFTGEAETGNGRWSL